MVGSRLITKTLVDFLFGFYLLNYVLNHTINHIQNQKINLMNKTIKLVLLIAGVLLLGYGFYTMVIPETQVSIGNLDIVEAQDNTNSYISIGLGILAVALSLLKDKSSK